MRTVVFLVLQIIALCGGSLLLWKLTQAKASSRIFWGVAWGIAACLGAAIFMFVQPVVVFEDFVPVYWGAGKAVLSGAGALLPLLQLGVDGGFVNLPIVAYLFTPFALLPPYVAGWLFAALGVVAVIVAWRLAADLFGFDRLERGISLLVVAGFGPLLYSLREGNSSHFMLLTLVLAIAALRKNRDVQAGLLLGFSSIIKPPLLLICVYAAIRLRWGVVFGAGLVIGVAAMLSLTVFGWDANMVWYQTNIGTFAREPIAASNSHSIASVLARLYHGAASISVWEPVHVPDSIRLTGLAGVALLGLVCLWAAAPWQRWVVGNQEFEADVMLIVALVLFVSTLTWTHYYCWLLLPAAWAWAQIQSAGGSNKPAMVLAGSMLLCSLAYLRWDPPELLLPLLHELFSYLLVGGLLLFGLLVWARRRLRMQMGAA